MAAVDFLSLGRPPRHVPLTVRVRLLFGGFLNQFGWIFFGFGMVFVWGFTLQADLTSWHVFRGRLETCEGTVTASKKTSFSEGGSKRRRGTPVYANHYSFTDSAGAEHQGVSYKTGVRLNIGHKVTVEYLAARPEISRIKGMRRSPVGPWGLLVVLFPLVGACLVILGIRRGLRAGRLLRFGEQTTGRLKSKTATNTKVNNQRVYKLVFDFEGCDGVRYEASAKTHRPEKLEDERDEPLLYDPMYPSRAVMLDALPGSPRIDQSGSIRAGSPLSVVSCLFIPAATLIGHGVYVYLRFFAR
ncbi:MAG: DUF3592 domain-containing protein [Phycisphaerales bacterium]|nr:MAG: DUF3592 domain-containing protein [Phycisphaerales bacterium]